MTLDPLLPLHKTQLKSIKDLNVRPEAPKVLQDMSRGSLQRTSVVLEIRPMLGEVSRICSNDHAHLGVVKGTWEKPGIKEGT